MTADPTPLSLESLQAALSRFQAHPFGAEIRYFPQIGSTNDVSRQLAEQGAPEGAVIVADVQTAGRGRLGRGWVAPPGSSLMMTTIFRPTLPAEFALRLVMAAGLAIAEAVEAIAPVRVDVKWPNDLQIGGKKFVGILPESALTGDRIEWVITGTGINVSQTFGEGDELRETATSILMASGERVDRAALFGLIMRNIARWNSRLEDERLLASWRKRCITLGQRVRVQSPAGEIEGVALDIGASGALNVRDDAGELHFINAGEATILRDEKGNKNEKPRDKQDG